MFFSLKTSKNIKSTTRHLKFKRNEKYKHYIQLDHLKTIKRTNSRLKRNTKMLLERNEKLP